MSSQTSIGRIAVIDVETTGLFPLRHDRVIEAAAVVLSPDGGIEHEFTTLVNPGRDIGPSRIHGLTSADVLKAPQFAEVAGHLLAALNGTVAIAGHNLRFDRQFLQCEFERLEIVLPDCHGICTLELAGGRSLECCCERFGISFCGQAHSALADARATAQLLLALLQVHSDHVDRLVELKPIRWPRVPTPSKQPVSREESRRGQAEPPSYITRLLGRVRSTVEPVLSTGAALAYSELLDRVLEDRHVDDGEADALVEMATRWGLDGGAIAALHHDYLHQLAVAAWDDGVVTDAERRDLETVARLLGQGEGAVDAALALASSESRSASMDGSAPREDFIGKRVCFTGEFLCTLGGEAITREMATALAEEAGLEVTGSVTKKLDLLVVADPQTQSGKAKKARQYGVRIMHEPVFWRAIGADVD